MPHFTFRSLVLFLLFSLTLFLPTFSQENPEIQTVKVYLDCSSCDMTFIKNEWNVVDYVRDQQLADVHVFITRMRTASGSSTFEFNYIGKGDFEPFTHAYTSTTAAMPTPDEVRKHVLRSLKIGLVPFLAQTTLIDHLDVSVKDRAGVKTQIDEADDPWNNWVFQLYGNGSLRSESIKNRITLNTGFSAQRITDAWRIRSRGYYYSNWQTFNNEENVIRSSLKRSSVSASVVKSLSSHWSAGLFAGTYSNSFQNLKRGNYGSPALEYNFFPYEEVSRRELTLAYKLGITDRSYFEETIYDRLEELLFYESLDLELRLRQPWGNVFVGLEGKHYFHDFKKNSLELDGNFDLRVYKGLSLRVSGSFELIRDQLSLPKGNASLEDILLQQTQLATDYEAYVSMGISYTFGSIYNNVVNTRL